MVGRRRILNLYQLAVRLDREGIPGDFVECGVANGGTGAVLAYCAAQSPLNRSVWLFDSFGGMPETSVEDGEVSRAYVGQVLGNVENVRSALSLVNADMEKVRIVEGFFQDTFGSVEIPRIALLNIDADWYESVKLCLERFFDSVVAGGVISIDDYGHWQGCRTAVQEFLKQRHLSPRLSAVDYTARWFRK